MGSNALLAEEIYRAYRPALLNFLRRELNGDHQAANDVAQEAFTRIIGAKRKYEPDEARGLLYRIARNLVIDHARLQRTRRETERAVADSRVNYHVPSAEGQISARQELALIEEAILALPPRCQEVYVLHRFENLSYTAIAARCGISPSAVEKHVQKALKRIVEVLRQSGNAEEL